MKTFKDLEEGIKTNESDIYYLCRKNENNENSIKTLSKSIVLISVFGILVSLVISGFNVNSVIQIKAIKQKQLELEEKIKDIRADSHEDVKAYKDLSAELNTVWCQIDDSKCLDPYE